MTDYCYWCKSSVQTVMNGGYYQVECDTCGVCGPMSPQREMAEKSYNAIFDVIMHSLVRGEAAVREEEQ